MMLWTPETAMLGDGTALGGLMIIAGGLGMRQALRMHARAAQIGALAVTGPAQAKPGVGRVRGRSTTQNPVISPFSQTPSCWYQVEIEKSADDGTSNGSGWRPIYRASSEAEFYIEDESGSVRVRPQGLETDLPWSFEQDVISAPTDAVQQRLVDYVAAQVPRTLNSWIFRMPWRAWASRVNAFDPVLQEGFQALRQRHHRALHEETLGQAYRFRETYLRVGQVCEIAGTLDSRDGDKALQKGPPGSPFFIGTNLAEGWGTARRYRALRFGAWSFCSLVSGVLILVFA